MKIIIDSKKIIEFTDLEIQIICDLINRNEFFEVICKTLEDAAQQFVLSGLKNLKYSWEEKLKDRGINIPEDQIEFVKLVFSQPDYLDRLDREVEAEALRTSGFKIE